MRGDRILKETDEVKAPEGARRYLRMGALIPDLETMLDVPDTRKNGVAWALDAVTAMYLAEKCGVPVKAITGFVFYAIHLNNSGFVNPERTVKQQIKRLVEWYNDPRVATRKVSWESAARGMRLKIAESLAKPTDEGTEELGVAKDLDVEAQDERVEELSAVAKGLDVEAQTSAFGFFALSQQQDVSQSFDNQAESDDIPPDSSHCKLS